MAQVLRYRRDDGTEPLTDWLSSLPDRIARLRIRARLLQIETGNFGDVVAVGNGVSELRIHVGPGYRVYFGRYGEFVVILLCGGDKRRQTADIQRAKAYWAEWKSRQP